MSECGVPLYDAEGGPTCGRSARREHEWHTRGFDLADNTRDTLTWQFTACWKFHDEAQRETGWNCTKPVGHDAVTESLSSGS
jgi:hypothetical protein